MVSSSLKSKIDALWLDFHSSGITNPITVIERGEARVTHMKTTIDLPDDLLVEAKTLGRTVKHGRRLVADPATIIEKDTWWESRH
ncbi:MAG: hypothetical protein ACFCU3_11265 [Verrucomicrobiales bacterium]